MRTQIDRDDDLVLPLCNLDEVLGSATWCPLGLVSPQPRACSGLGSTSPSSFGGFLFPLSVAHQ